MSVATLFERLRGRRERGGDAWDIAKRVAGGEDVAVDAIVAACSAADMTTTAFESAVAMCQRRAGWRRQLASRSEVDRERASVSSKIETLDAGLRRAQESHETSIEPLRVLRERLADRSREIGNAQEDLRRDVPQHMKAARESANRALLEASGPLAKAESARAATLVEISLVEKSLAAGPTTSPERPESKAWRAAKIDRDNELTEKLASLRSVAENAAARIAELTPIVAKAKAAFDAAEQSAFNF